MAQPKSKIPRLEDFCISQSDRWERDEQICKSCNEESHKEWGRDFTREDVLDADEIAAHEK